MSEKPQVQVDELDMLRQMVKNFNKPLELIREAISNSYDAGANNIDIWYEDNLGKVTSAGL